MKDYLNNEPDPLLDPLIKSYYEANLNLVRTIAFKSSRSAIAQNKNLINNYNYNVDEQSPETWKYYLNLSGNYHPLDKEMIITSLDTLEQITFSKETLAVNPSTKIEYRFGSPYYKTLVSLYPEQEDLILGILLPCDIELAINARDGTILRYDPSLVEQNECSLIKELELSIFNHMARWYIDAYSITDNYYLMSYYSLLSQYIFTKLLNLRDKQRRTYETHSFHVRMFLRGYFGLDKYYIYLNQEQAMYLYRNLPRLTQFMGYDSQFQELLEKILSSRNIQMSGYVVRQTNSINSDYTPLTIVQSEPLNKTDNEVVIETLTPYQLFLKEETVLYGTTDYYDANLDKIKFQVNHQEQAKVITKDVITQSPESANIFPSTLDDFLLSHWGYMAATGMYTGTITYEDPETGNNVTLTPRDAFVYFYYLTLSYISQSLVLNLIKNLSTEQQSQIANIDMLKVVRKIFMVPRFLSQLHSSVSSNLGVNDLLSLVELEYRSELIPIANAIFNKHVPLTAVNNPELFYNLCLNVYKAYIDKNGIAISLTDPISKGYAKNMVLRTHQDSLVNLYPDNSLISSFLEKNKLKAYEDIKNFLPELIINIYQSGTGSSFNISSNQNEITKALLGIIKNLTSYNIQYINIIEQTKLTLVNIEPVSINGKRLHDTNNPTTFIRNIATLDPSVNIQEVVVTYH